MKPRSRVAPTSVGLPNREPELPDQSDWQKRQDHERRVIQTYRSPSRRDFNPTDSTHYLNIGYWSKGARTLDEAAQAMADLVGEAGHFEAEQAILDAGCGYGDADIFWLKQFCPRRIVGIDINSYHVERAGRRVAEMKLEDRIEFRVASAVEMPFEDASFNKVVAMESSHHFLTRLDFFREAHRVLKPGGSLVTTDVLVLPGRRAPFINPVNSYSADVYEMRLAEAGFTNISVTSIRDSVFRPYSTFLLQRLSPISIKSRFNILLHRLISSRLDYVLARADKL